MNLRDEHKSENYYKQNSLLQNVCSIKKLRCAVFAHYDKNNKVQDYVIYYLKELKKVIDTIVFVSDCNLSPKESNKLQEITNHIIAKRHGGYDFGSYKIGFLYMVEKSLLTNCEELIFCNDSCYGPLYSFVAMFDKMQTKNYDFWGVTYNPHGLAMIDNGVLYKKDYPHVQSFFLVFKPQVFNSNIFLDFIKNIKKEKIKWDVIINYEIGLTEYLNKNGFKEGMYCELCHNHSNSHYLHYLKLILVDKCPLLKTSIVRNKKQTNKLLIYIKRYTDYDAKLIMDDLKYNSNYTLKSRLQSIFSIKNSGVHKVITILGIKFKFKSKKLLKRYNICNNK